MLALCNFLQAGHGGSRTRQHLLDPCVKIQAHGKKVLKVCDSLAFSSSSSSVSVVCMRALADCTRVLEGSVLASVCELVSLVGRAGEMQLKVRLCATASLP